MPENKYDYTIEDAQSFVADMTREYTSPVTQIYIDLPYIQDIYLGTVLLQIETEEQYKEVIKRIPKYNERKVFDRFSFFEDIFSKDLLVSYLENPGNTKKILVTSPFTNAFLNLRTSHYELEQYNKIVTGNNTKTFITYIVNTYPLILDGTERQKFKSIFEFVSDRIQLGVLSSTIDKTDLTMLSKSQILLIDNWDLFVGDNETTAKAYYLKQIFRNAQVFTPRLIYGEEFLKELPTMEPENIEKSLQMTEAVMGLCSQFKYLTPIVLLKNTE